MANNPNAQDPVQRLSPGSGPTPCPATPRNAPQRAGEADVTQESHDTKLGEPLWTVHDVARYQGVHEKTIYLWTARRELPCFHVGNRLRFAPSDVSRWLQAPEEGD